MTERTHCIHGHPWVPENLYVYARRYPMKPKVMCITCTKQRAIESRRQKAARRKQEGEQP